jgi:phage tail sheath gpL-like
MAANTVLYIAIPVFGSTALGVQDKVLGSGKQGAGRISDLINFLAQIDSGGEVATVLVAQDDASGTAATGTLAFASAVNGNTFSVAGITFTIKTAADPNDNTQVTVGGSDTAMGDNVVTAVNGHPSLKKMLVASNSSGTVTFTMNTKGLFGNLLKLVGGTHVTASTPTNGAVGTMTTGLRVHDRF